MRLPALLVAIVTLAACNGNSDTKISVGGSFAPSSTMGIGIEPSQLTLVPGSSGLCPTGPAVGTAFDLIIVPSDTLRPRVDEVTIHLIDGTNLGGPMVTIPRPELERQFGSTILSGPRTFPFQPMFGCGFPGARIVVVDAVLVSEIGTVTKLSTRARIQ